MFRSRQCPWLVTGRVVVPDLEPEEAALAVALDV
jgi:hypothetical protein